MSGKRNYERLPIKLFGKQLLESKDLDPIYVALHQLTQHDGWDNAQVERWMIAYWCFYHAGVASYLSEFKGASFWAKMLVAAANETQTPVGTRWPRGSERRHFRGKQGTSAIAELGNRYGNEPEKMVHFIGGAGGPYATVEKRIRQHRSFGPWISFKVADMLERICGYNITFENSEIFMFDSPTKAAFMVWASNARKPVSTSEPPEEERDGVIKFVVDALTDHFQSHEPPPRGGRPLGLQEVETILCKWKSHVRGHYPLYNDIDEINEGLEVWATKNDSAKMFLANMPKRP